MGPQGHIRPGREEEGRVDREKGSSVYFEVMVTKEGRNLYPGKTELSESPEEK